MPRSVSSAGSTRTWRAMRPLGQPVSFSTSPRCDGVGRCRRLSPATDAAPVVAPLRGDRAAARRSLRPRAGARRPEPPRFSPTLDGDGDAAMLRLIVPTWRSDVTLPADVVEEVARVIGYETLPERLPTGQTAPVQRDPVYAMQRAVRSVLTGAGGWETVTYIAISDDDLRRLDPGRAVRGSPSGRLLGIGPLAQPASGGPGVLRPTLLPSLLAVAAENLKHEDGVRLFETARVYLPSDDELPREANVLGMVFAGQREPLGRFRPLATGSWTSSTSRERSRR